MAQSPSVLRHHAAFSGVDRYFEASLYLLVVTGFATLVTTGKLDVWSIALVSAALALRGYFLLGGRHAEISERWTSYLTLGYVLFYAADFLFLSADFVAATVHLVLFSMVVKVFSARRDRDHLYLAILAFLEVLAAAVLTVDSVFLVAFAVFLLLAITTFTSMEMRRSSLAAKERARTSAVAPERMAALLSSAGVGLMIAILIGAGAVFLILPRVSIGYLSALAPRNQLVSGFSENVRLGEIGEVKQLNTVVMHIEIEGGKGQLFDLKWRGISLGLFDGKRWFNPAQPLHIASALDGRYDLRPLQSKLADVLGEPPGAPAVKSIKYRVLMEPIGTNVFFVVPKARILVSDAREISLDAGGALFNTDRDQLINTYEGISDIAEPGAEELRATVNGAAPQIALRYLQLPKLDARVRALTEQVTGSATSDYDRAVAIERHLKTRYTYTLQLPSTPPRDALAHFLFERKEGHCEYFASAMTVMLRTLGIPARLVNGFRGGEYNDITGNYIIRARDAHSWVEAYFPGHGWISFDPTPPDPRDHATSWSRFMLYVDAMREFWREWVINYDQFHQRSLATSATSRGRHMVDRTGLWTRKQYMELLRHAAAWQHQATQSPRRWGGPAFGGVVLFLLLLNAKKIYQGLRNLQIARSPGLAPQTAASIWYARMTRALARRGWRKLPSQTPGEFVSTIADPQLRDSVAQFTAHYERARFGESVEDAEILPRVFEHAFNRKLIHEVRSSASGMPAGTGC